ncbi:low-temperature-induced 65 kDa protein-like [Gastrolobium bilobum]|uniref:low-temperature-induced 65 kDa protein-like n=1 Tax=Gastrolobium bilobum TaxID=150636 RepID=UPI002AB27E5D|nr:low-temperature-induced 65 kDa protein-like [Gastrolobium bilobum]
MNSRVVQSNMHEYDQHHDPHNVGLQQGAHGVEEHNHDHEKKSVLKKVKAKAKKIKDTITKHGHHDHDHEHGHEYHYEDQHIPDDHDLDEENDDDDEMVEDPEIHGAPMYDSAAARNATPGQVNTLGKPGVNFGDAKVMGEELHHEPRVVVVSPTAEINQSRSTDPARTFVGEEKAHKFNLERPMDLEEDPHAPGSRPEAFTPANYQTKVTDPTGAGGAEIDIKPIQKSFDRMTIHNEPKPNPEPKVILPTIAETQYPAAHSHHQFVPELSTATKTLYPPAESHGQYLPELSSEIKTQYPKNQDRFMPELSTTTNQYPSAESHNQNLSKLSSTATKSQYPSAGSHDQFAKTQYPSAGSHDQFAKTQYPSAGSHDQFANTQYPSAGSHDQFTNTQYPSAGSHDQFAKTQYPYAGSHDQFLPELSTELPKTQYPSARSHDQYLPQQSSATITEYPSTRSHDHFIESKEKPSNQDEFMPEFSTSTTKTQYPSARGQDRNLSEMSSAKKTQYPSSGSHDQFLSELSTEPKTQNPYVKSHDQYLSQEPSTTKTEYPSAKSHDQFVESVEKPSNQSSYAEKISSATSAIADNAVATKNMVASKLGYGEKGDRDEKETRWPHEEDNTIGENPSNQSSYKEKISSATTAIADKAVSATNTVASKLGFGEKGDSEDDKVTTQEEKKSENTSDYGKKIALSLTEKLAPVCGKVAGVGSARKSQFQGTANNENVVIEQDRGVSVKDYLVDKLRPGDEDRALSEVISETLYKKEEEPKEVNEDKVDDMNLKKLVSDAVHKREEEPERREKHLPLEKVTESEEVKKRLGSGDENREKSYAESYVNSPGKGVVDKLKGVVGSWFGNKPEENQSSQDGEDLSKNSGDEVEQVNQAAGERRHTGVM